MSVTLPNAGTHVGKVNGRPSIYEAGTGSLCLAIPVILANSEIAWHGKHTMTLVNKDGESQGRALQTLKEVFGWDGTLETIGEQLIEKDFADLEFELVCEHKEYTPEGKDEPVTVFQIKFLNPLGGGSRIPESMDLKSVLAKYGAKFRALSGKPVGKPATKAAAAPKEETPQLPTASAPPKKSGPPAGKAKTAGGQPPTATMEEAWEACQKANSKLSEDAKGEAWYNKVEELFPGKTNDDLTIQELGALKVAFEA